ncbi:tyrosyl-DNA phosphodiesterase 1 isoform X5 [Malania oleifera]|uniref:tyrosyl-DNA phosphodiesterase 1 isoform X5 n=1 Tax=Malania oleifera TaxID=397392 RepID=UPI0025AE3911|nr:tyrosyl-DNA phosphodiesterase 1 isoform X5 [Malania oleifera]
MKAEHPCSTSVSPCLSHAINNINGAVSEQDQSIPKLPVSQGPNPIGRINVVHSDKRLSRKHLTLVASLDGSADVVVEGTNPVVVNSRGQRKKLYAGVKAKIGHGDIIELIPGLHFYKYVTFAGDDTNKGSSNEGERLSEAQGFRQKRMRLSEDKAPGSHLKAELENKSLVQERSMLIKNSGYCHSNRDNSSEAIRHFNVSDDILPLTFRLLRVQGLPAWANTSSVSIGDVVQWPEFPANLPSLGNFNINPSFFKKFDYGSSAVRLIASVPGYHTGPNLKKWGHMKLRTVLQECIFDKEFHRAPLVYQFSSLGSLDEKWMAELAFSMSAGISEDKKPLGLGDPLIIWPTLEDVRCSLEGYAAGNAIPSPMKNVEKEFLKKYWAKWKAGHSGRGCAMPHIKTYTRYNGQELAWLLLTSANLSKAAWGALQKNNSQLMIRSYELGVLFLPFVKQCGHRFSCTDNGGSLEDKRGSKNFEVQTTKLVTLTWQGGCNTHSSSVVPLPVPYELPPQRYSSEDVPWSWDGRYNKKDVHGQVWPRHVQLYTF